jgi:hypothetical protein
VSRKRVGGFWRSACPVRRSATDVLRTRVGYCVRRAHNGPARIRAMKLVLEVVTECLRQQSSKVYPSFEPDARIKTYLVARRQREESCLLLSLHGR